MSEVTIRGKTVQVLTSFRGREWYSLPADYRKAAKALTAGDYAGAIPFLSRVIESWEFAGDPHDAAAYEALDALAELEPLTGAVLMAVREAAFPAADAGG